MWPLTVAKIKIGLSFQDVKKMSLASVLEGEIVKRRKINLKIIKTENNHRFLILKYLKRIVLNLLIQYMVILSKTINVIMN